MTDFYSNEVKITETGVSVAKSDWTSQKFSCVYNSLDADGNPIYTKPTETITATFTISGDTTATPNVYWKYEIPETLFPNGNNRDGVSVTTGNAADVPSVFNTNVTSNIVNGEKIYTATISISSTFNLPKEYHGLRLRLTYDTFSVTKDSITYNFSDADTVYHQAIINDAFNTPFVYFTTDLNNVEVNVGSSTTVQFPIAWKAYRNEGDLTNYTTTWQISDDNKVTWNAYTPSALGSNTTILSDYWLPDGSVVNSVDTTTSMGIHYPDEFVTDRYYRLMVTYPDGSYIVDWDESIQAPENPF